MRRFIRASSCIRMVRGQRAQSSAIDSSLPFSHTPSPVDGIEILSVNRPPANVLDAPTLTKLLAHFKQLADIETSGCKGVVLTSQLPTVFCAGLDLQSFLQEPFDDAAFTEYWSTFQELFVTLHTFPVPLVAAINGHALGFGCLLAMACDYRVMSRKSEAKKDCTIGIPATKAGFSVPPFLAKNVVHLIGSRNGEELLTRSALYSADEAFKKGVVDEVVEDASEAAVAAVHEVERYLEMPAYTRWLIKDHMRRPVVWQLRTPQARKVDLDGFRGTIQAPSIRRDMREYLAQLKERKTPS